MRRLGQPKVVASAAIAAALSTLLSLPRMLLWENRKFYLWDVEAVIFFCGFVLWAFVFAWHTEYTRRPLFTLKVKPGVFAMATLLGICGAAISRRFFDPYLRTINPEEYPADFVHWLASILFVLTFSQLFLLFAPYAWAMRLFHNERIAMGFTVALSLAVWLLKVSSSSHPLPSWLFFSLLVSRIIQGVLAVWFYSRGGVLLAWWLGLLIEARHLLDFQHF